MAGISVHQDIAAPARQVWSIFSDLSKYERWNPFIVKAVGQFRYNTSLKMTIVTLSGSRVEFSPHVIEFTKGQRMAWRTGMRIPGLFARVVIFEVKPTDESSCQFTITVEPRGLLVPLRRGFISNLETGYTNMLAALKAEAENPSA